MLVAALTGIITTLASIATALHINTGTILPNTPNNIAKQIQKQGKIFTIKCADRAVLNDVVRAIEDEKEIMKIMRAAGIPAVGRISYGKNENSTCITIHIQ